jgi:hypothetical protein
LKPHRLFRLNLGVCLLMLLLAFAFMAMAGGLPPGRVALPMGHLLTFRPWAGYFQNAGLHPNYLDGDVVSQQLPWRAWAQGEFAAGRFPLWASGPLGGYPIFANAQSSVLYPLHLLWILMPVGAGFGIILALKLWLTGLGMWALLRAMSLHPAGALFGSLGLMFSAYVVNWLPWNLSSTYLLFPWLLWSVYMWWTIRRAYMLILLALFIAFAVLGGHPETLFIMGVAIAVWLACHVLTNLKDHWWLKIGALVPAVVVGLGMGAVQLLPFFEALGLSHQEALRVRDAAGYSTLHLHPEQWLDWILPHFWSYNPDLVLSDCCSPYDSSYVGLVALCGVVLLLVAALRRGLAMRLVLPWVGVGVFAWLVTYDVTVGGLIRALPIFSLNANVRWVGVVSFAVLVLGSFGWDWLARVVELSSNRFLYLASAGYAIVLAALLYPLVSWLRIRWRLLASAALIVPLLAGIILAWINLQP